jgi:hypothetical protein
VYLKARLLSQTFERALTDAPWAIGRLRNRQLRARRDPDLG